MRRAWQRLRALFYRDRLDRELDGDVQAHLELAERDALAAGLSPEDARRDARRRLSYPDYLDIGKLALPRVHAAGAVG